MSRIDPEIKEFEVWLEGYCATGCENGPVPAQFIGKFEAQDFRDACHIAAMTIAHGNLYTFFKYYSINHNTWWACRFFDNEADARESFG